MERICVSDAVYSDAVTKGMGVCDYMAQKFEGEIAGRIAANPKLAGFSPVQLAMLDAGLTNKSTIKAFYTTTGNEWLFPAILETKITETVDKTPLLAALLASTRTVATKDVHTLKVDFNTDEAKKALEKRDVAEGAELPEVKIGESKHTIAIHKRGLAVVSTYEAIQFATLNMFLETIAEVMRYSANQQIGDAIKVLIEGDGNSNAAVSTDTAAGAVLLPDDITDFLIDFTDASDGLSANTLLVNKAVYKQLAKMFVSSTQENAYRPGTMFTFPQTMFDGLSVIYDRRVPQIGGKDIVLGLDSKSALDKYVVANSIINEFGRDIRSQKQIGTLSEMCGFGKRNDKAARVLKLK